MFQLVYTSSPRLLEAGKTGFGTVARNRQLPAPLVSHLERISSFDRASGINSHVYYSVFRMGALYYHIFSRVGDSGVDYTQRTNHIAHHWILPDENVTNDGFSHTTPAGILQALQNNWLLSWNGNPQWFEEESYVTAPIIPSQNAWAKLTGTQENGLWLQSAEFKDGGNILLPEHCDEHMVLALLHEAFLQRNDKGWGLGFTTAADGNLSRMVCPLVCFRHSQISADSSTQGGYPHLHIHLGLQPPFVPTPASITPRPAMPVPQQERQMVSEFHPIAQPQQINQPPSTSASPPLVFFPVSPHSEPLDSPPEKKGNNFSMTLAVGSLAAAIVIAGLFLYNTGDSSKTKKTPSTKLVKAKSHKPQKQEDNRDRLAPKPEDKKITEELPGAPADSVNIASSDAVAGDKTNPSITASETISTAGDVQSPEAKDAEVSATQDVSQEATDIEASNSGSIEKKEFRIEMAKLKPSIKVELNPEDGSAKIIVSNVTIQESQLRDANPKLGGYNLYYKGEEIREKCTFEKKFEFEERTIGNKVKKAYADLKRAEKDKETAEEEWKKGGKFEPKIFKTREECNDLIKKNKDNSKEKKELIKEREKAETWFTLKVKKQDTISKQKELDEQIEQAEKELKDNFKRVAWLTFSNSAPEATAINIVDFNIIYPTPEK